MPDAIVLSHEHELTRLAKAVPEAVDRAVVAGDPCLDRMRASRQMRRQYRSALGVEPDQHVVTVSSTWGPNSLLGRHPDLIAALLGELTLDDHVVAAIVHPNAWFAHGQWQLRTWLADALRSGLRLIPPVIGWQHTILASSVVVGDHGAVTAYAASNAIPTLLASFPETEVAPGSAVDVLGRTAKRLDPLRSFSEQISTARTENVPGDVASIAELASSRPGECAQLLRSTFYRLMDLSEPSTAVPVFPYAATDLHPNRQPVQACWLACDPHTVGSGAAVRVRRWPADVTVAGGRGPRAVPTYLAVDSEHPRRDLYSNADIVVVGDLGDPDIDSRLADIVRTRPACSIAVAVTGPTHLRIHHRRLGPVGAELSSPITGVSDVSAVAAAIHDRHIGGPSDQLPSATAVLLGSQRLSVVITPVIEPPAT
ncbi:hypothetical protein [Nocardia sp. NPDC051570]|uniref:hypothetical protein n=1 Tax=Nocardia sp. NPDC051570 TaxID=3364324 RepID=UPI003794C107